MGKITIDLDIDSAKVTRGALENAASIAALILIIKVLVANRPQDGV